MAHLDLVSAIGSTWEILGLVWLVGWAFTKPTVRSQSVGSRVFQMAIALFGFTLLGNESLGGGWLGQRFLHASPRLESVGFALTVAGCMFAIWARVTLGSNWSARATVKAEHELVVAGPYALVRHPIYTGLLVAAIGTGLATAEWRCILGLVLIALVFAAKMGLEEKLMIETFPQAYPRYRQRVKALIPGLL